MKKNLLAVFLVFTLLLCVSPVSAAYVEKITVPQASQVQAVYLWQTAKSASARNELRRYQDSAQIQKFCSALSSLAAGSSVLNVPKIPEADLIFELRTGNGNMMRYHIYSKKYYNHTDRIISQRVQNGQAYQGMGFTGGNVSAVIDRLWELYGSIGAESFRLPFDLTSGDVSDILLFHYNDLTYTRVNWGPSVDYVINLLRVLKGAPNDNRPATVSQTETGKPLSELNDLVIVLRDGTRFTCKLYEKGLEVQKTTDNVNVDSTCFYHADAGVYQQLINYLHANQSACSPAWLGSMNPARVTQVTVVSPDGTKMKTADLGDAALTGLVETVSQTPVVPLTLQKRSDFSNQSGAYGITMRFNSGVTYTIDYSPTTIEVASSDMSYIASYRISGDRDTAFLKKFMNQK